MATTPEAAALTDAYRTRLAAIRQTVTRTVTRPWIDAQDLDGDLTAAFDGWLDDAVTVTELAQARAARLGDIYISQYLQASGVSPVSSPVDPDRHVGTDFDGRPLDAALDGARIATLWMLGRRRGRARALAYGLDTAIRLSRSSVMTATRGAAAERMTVEPRIDGWRRIATARACGACLALSGRRSATSDPFDAHDRCRCTAEPLVRGVAETVPRPDGQQQFDQMSREERIERFGEVKTAAAERHGIDVLVLRTGGRIKEATPASVA